MEKIEFMRKSRFELIKTKFDDIDVEAQKIIDVAQPDDILKLDITFNSPLKIVKAEPFDEGKFIEAAF